MTSEPLQFDDFNQALTRLVKLACTCNAMAGFVCSAHEIALELNAAHIAEIKAAVGRLFEQGQ